MGSGGLATDPRTREGPVIDTQPSTLAAARPTRRRRLSVLVVAALAALVALSAFAPVASAGTAYDMEQQILGYINRDRSAAGLVPYRKWSALASVAGKRAARMASLNVLSHTAAGPYLSTQLNNAGIQWYDWGEAIGKTSYRWGSDAAKNLYHMWMGSSPHRAMLMSTGYNYIGIGVAYRSSNHTTYASIVVTDSKDHTGAVGRNGSLSAAGTTVDFSWTGYDPKLQKRTAGLRSFDVQVRVDGGTWSTALNDTTTLALSLADRPRGHWYGFRVQAADTRGTLGKWTSEARIWVP